MSTTERLASRYQTLFTAASSSDTSWLITTRPPLCCAMYPRSQAIESESRWLVGSSSSRMPPPPWAASRNRMRASSMRRRWPPDSVPMVCASTRSGRPRFAQIRAASASATDPLLVRALLQLHLELLHLGEQRVQAPSGQHPVASGHVQVAGARILGQI